ncbi:MAG TPA: hypothetical protein VFE31_14880 [Opitutaceae bacterium]|jgi:hypothetical protein|nr:hypothetical protein [Opitutaceae bacterium]
MSASAGLPRWAQAAAICAAGAAAAAALWLTEPRRGDLGPVDFTAGGPDALQFCDPEHPRFIAVANRVSPVVLKEEGAGLFSLRTATGKWVGARDLQGGRLRFFAVDSSLTRFATGIAEAAGKGKWRWTAPAGMTHVFADFVPIATGQEMYASAPLAAEGGPSAPPPPAGLAVSCPRQSQAGQTVEVRARASVPVELAAFDLGRSGPTGFVVRGPESAADGDAAFHLTFDDPGRYVLWCRAGAAQGRTELTVTP